MKFSSRRIVRYIIECAVLLVMGLIIILYANDYKEQRQQEKEKEQAMENQEQNKVFDLWYSYTGYEPYLKEAAKRYEEKTGIKVRITYYTTIDYLEKISSASAEGNGPDMFLLSEDSLQNAVLLGIIEQNYDTDILNEHNYCQKAIKSVTYVEKQYGYPLGFETTVFAANKTYVDNMPDTFDEVKVFADNFNNGDENAGHDYSKVSSILKWDISDILYSYGFLGAYLDVCGEMGDNPTIIDVKNENAIKAGEYYYSLSQYFYTEAEDARYEKVMEEFFNGQIIYTIASADIINRIAESDMNVELSVLPALTDKLSAKAVSVTDIIAVNPFADMKEEAIEFSKFLSYDMADEMFNICGVISTRNIEYENENIDKFIEAYEQSKGLPKLMTTSDYWLKISNITKKIWYGSNVKEELMQLYTELNERIN